MQMVVIVAIIYAATLLHGISMSLKLGRIKKKVNLEPGVALKDSDFPYILRLQTADQLE